MTEPSGAIVARPMLKRACGCVQEFQHYAVDKYRAQRQAKFQRTRCPACVAKMQEEQRRTTALPKGEAFKMLPPGTQVALTSKADGTWSGTLTAEGKSVEADGMGPGAALLALARRWLITHGDVGDAPPT